MSGGYIIREQGGRWNVLWYGKLVATFMSKREAESFVMGKG